METEYTIDAQTFTAADGTVYVYAPMTGGVYRIPRADFDADTGTWVLCDPAMLPDGWRAAE